MPQEFGASPLVVDHQIHWYPRAAVEKLRGRSRYPKAERDADGGYVLWLDEGASQPLMNRLTMPVEEHLAQATEAGVDVLVFGPATMGEVLQLPGREAADLLDNVHVEYAAAQREHPERLACLAALPMQDPAVALEVLDRAIGELDLRGVSFLTTFDEQLPLISDDTLAVFARIAELGVPLFLHPGHRSSTRIGTHSPREEFGLAWTYQTALVALRLIDEGVLDAVPDLTVVHPHLGGVLPYVVERLNLLGGGKAEHYLRTRFYADTACGNPGALRLAIERYGIERIVFASDHPFVPITETRRHIEEGDEGQDAHQIYANRVPGLRLPVPA